MLSGAQIAVLCFGQVGCLRLRSTGVEMARSNYCEQRMLHGWQCVLKL